MDEGRRASGRGDHVPPAADTGVAGRSDAAACRPSRCPFCGSDRTELISLFGSTLLTSQCYCRDCRSAFEQVKWGRGADGAP